MSDSEFDQAADPEEAFTALADETRVSILRALWEAEESKLSFSTLREAVGMRDSGQFNYHLDKLTDRFVAKTEGGYHLMLAGYLVNGAISAGAFTMEGTIDERELADPCALCGGTRTFRYENETATFDCASCDHRMSMPAPPGVFSGVDSAEVPTVASRYLRTVLQQVRSGFCWFCDGQVDTELDTVGSFAPEEAGDLPFDPELPIAVFTCRRRPSTFPISVDLGSALHDEPVVAGFFADHDIDIQGPDWWQYSVLDPEDAYFQDESASRACVTYTLEQERLRVVVNDDLEVLETRRTAD
jgi:hypothetical protein